MCRLSGEFTTGVGYIIIKEDICVEGGMEREREREREREERERERERERDTGVKQSRGHEAELLLLKIIVTADVVAIDSEEKESEQ